MTPERWQRVKQLFEAALDQDRASRESFLNAAAADDPTLAEEVTRLLASDEKAGTFLSAPPQLALNEPVVVRIGRHVGPYRVLGEIAHGGMGAVFRAVRDDDQYQKVVAIKLMQGGIGSAPVLGRFKAERQILANLEHPNIARLIDGGTTEEGWPYFSMELVEGEPIDQYCASRDLSTAERLELFRTVCAAVQYAHQRLVVHRDLKPSNILVAKDGTPKLLDFGIAKLLDVEAPGKTTLTALPLMTPEYASPEQVKGEPITTASDVYSLGLLLYELLARKRAYEIPTRSPEEIARVVCNLEPQPPSAAAPKALARQLSGDLDTIVMKAIRKEPSRRYASVQELSEDVRRHLIGLPVLARGDTFSYRAGKFVRRHKAGVAAGVLLAISLVGGIVATERQARIAEANRARAERRFNDVRKLANSLLFEFHDAIQNLSGSTKARELVVKRALEYLDSLSQEAREDVALQRELAGAYQRLGDAQGGGGQGNLGDTKGALASYQKALAIRRALVVSPAQPEDEEGLTSLERQLSRLFIVTGDLREGEEVARAAIARLESLAAKTGSDQRAELTRLYGTLGHIQVLRGDVAAVESLGKAVTAGNAWCAAHPDDTGAKAALARIQSELAGLLGGRGEHHRAAELARSTWTILEQLVAADPDNAAYRRNLIFALNVGSEELEADSDLRGANRALRRSVELAEALMAVEPGNPEDQIALGYSQQWLGIFLVRSGETEAGFDHLRQAVRVAEVTIKADPANAFARGRMAEIRAELGLALHKVGRRNAEMCSSLRQSVAYWDDLERKGRPSGLNRVGLERSRAALAACPRRSP